MEIESPKSCNASEIIAILFVKIPPTISNRVKPKFSKKTVLKFLLELNPELELEL